MNDFRFEQPNWGHLIWPVALLVATLVWLEFRQRTALDTFMSSRMQERLVNGPSRIRRLLALGFLTMGLVACILAAMRPQWGATERLLPQVGAEIMVCLDVSKSMLAEDTIPSRLERAKAEIRDLLDLMRGEQVGLIAFAGKATVISPMTTDFAFLKLALDHVGPQSVGLGGTRLEEPIRAAVRGFADTADVSRVILLITDGEDHDSFPLAAAEAARERGIRMITVGFGDEAGSKIQVTDPRTGARTYVTDASGNAVISRLDGELLREIALRTEGAYIPAGTGALDLPSIHRQYIAPLMRGRLESARQVIRHEAYQWPLLLGILCLILSVIVGRNTGRRDEPLVVVAAHDRKRSPSLLVLVFLLAGVTLCRFAPAADQADKASVPTSTDPQTVTQPAPDDLSDSPDQSLTKDTEAQPPLDPREAYNRSLALWSADPDAAESLLQQARQHAGNDGEVRFRAGYNLGWVEVERADRMLASDPEQALVHLRAAADWFREAIRIRPKNQDARQNLELVLRRALELADALARQESGSVAQQLDVLIQRQRELLSSSGELIERLAGAERDAIDDEVARRDLRGLATTERQILSDTSRLLQQTAEDAAAMRRKPAAEQTDEQRYRAAQLERVNFYLPRATQRLGQARSQYRRRQPGRAFRRSSAALDEFKRARDMLRTPQETLRTLLQDTAGLSQQSSVLARSGGRIGDNGQPAPPRWLTKDLVTESQLSLAERTAELAELIEAAAGDQTSVVGPQPPEAAADASQLRFAQAAPLVRQAADAQQQAHVDLEKTASWDRVTAAQTTAQQSLADALEIFLDLRGLIEATHTTESRLEQALARANEEEMADRLSDDELPAIYEAFVEAQRKNMQRTERLKQELQREQEQLDAAKSAPANGPADTAQPPSSPEEQAANEQRLGVARQTLRRAERAMLQLESQLGQLAEPTTIVDAAGRIDNPDGTEQAAGANATEKMPETVAPPAAEESPSQAEGQSLTSTAEEPSPDLPPSANDTADASEETLDPRQAKRAAALKTAAEATKQLQELRRLFFSLTEHLQETAQRQTDLNDRTQTLAGETSANERDMTLGPLAEEQQQLEQFSRVIAEALDEQAQAPASDQATMDDASGSPNQPTPEQVAEAAQLVQGAADAMQSAVAAMEADSEAFELPRLRDPQDEAFEQLKKALDLLLPPESSQNDQQNQQSEEQQEASEPQPAPAQEKNQQKMNMNQLLQMIRDRDAQRRDEKEKQQPMGSAPVEKDW